MGIFTADAALLTAALDSVPQGILITNQKAEIVWSNSAFTTMSGFSAEDVLGQSVTLNHGDIVCRTKQGRLYASAATSKAFDSAHNLISLSPQPHASSDLENDLENAVRLIAGNAADVIWLWSLAQAKCVFITPSVTALRGFTPDEIMTQTMAETMSEASYRVATEQLADSLARVNAGDDSARVRMIELQFRRKDGSLADTETMIRLLSGNDGQVRYVLGITRDIADRKQRAFEAERALQAQRAMIDAKENYRKIYEGAMEGIYRAATDGRLIAANPAWAKMLGYDSPDELFSQLTGSPYQFWVDQSERDRFVAVLEQRGMVHDFECNLRRKDGRVIWVSLNCKRVSGNGGPPYNEGFMEDITARKLMEDALRQSEERFAKAFLSSPVCLCINDAADGGRILDVNEAFEQTTGYARAEAIGNTLAELNLLTDSANGRSMFARLISDGKLRNVEHRFRRKSGEMRVGLLSAELIELDGRLCAITTSIDITERTHAEETIRSLATAVEQAAETIVITGLDGSIEYANPAFEKTTGYSREEALGKNPRLLNSGRQSPEFYRKMWATIQSGAVWTGQFTNRRKDGSLFEEEATISPIRDTSGRIKGYVAIKRDVSERIQLEHQFRQAQKLESVGRLAGGVAHDFNNLLTVISGYSGLLLEELKPYDPLYPYVDEIRKAGERAAALTRQLLAFSRKQVIEVRALDLNAIVRDADRMLRRLIGEDVELRTALHPALGQVMADPDQIHQIIMNLVVNARDAMPHGGTLVIETNEAAVSENMAATHPDAKAGQYVLMSVSDTGTGMDEQTLEKIFEPFFTTKEPGKGTGLGLSTVYGILRHAGGWVEVSSRIGLGTTFRVFLPRVEAATAAAIAETVTPSSFRGRGETVLLVEDQDELRRLAKTVLRMHGYDVLEAGNGAEALRIAQQHTGNIHVLLTDVVMPVMNGDELSERMKHLHPGIKVVFSSGYAADMIAQRGIIDPGVEYLPKPFTARELVSKVRDVLTRAL